MSFAAVDNPIVERSWADVDPLVLNGRNGSKTPKRNIINTLFHDDRSKTSMADGWRRDEVRRNDPKDKDTASEMNAKEEQSLSFMEIVAFSVNYVMGTGFLTIPWAFYQAGVVLSLFTMLIVIVPALFSILYILEAMARVTVILDDENKSKDQSEEVSGLFSMISQPSYVPMGAFHASLKEEDEEKHDADMEEGKKEGVFSIASPPSYVEEDEEDENYDHDHHPIRPDLGEKRRKTKRSLKSLKSFIGRRNKTNVFASVSPSSELMVGKKKYEVSELCSVFIGRNAKFCYMAVLSIYMYGLLWAYASVFSNALLIYLDFGPGAYYAFLFLFALFVCPMSCAELTEQKTVQLTLAWCRVIMVLIMVTTVLIAFASPGEPFGEDTKNPDFSAHMVDFEGLYLILPVAVYANAFHHSIPTLAEPAADKRKLASIFSFTLGCCFVSYAIIGVTLAVYFGDVISPSVNTNWNEFGHFHQGIGPFLGRIAAIYVIIFPALDVASAFPLNAVTLGNSLLTAVYGNATPARSIVVTFRLMAAIPPIIGASVVSDLGKITDYTGIAGMVICFVFPSLLGLYSEKYFYDRRVPSKTIYSSCFTHRYVAIAMLVFSTVIILYCGVALMIHDA